MAYYARQKRQSRFYWAELGFIALGLLGLQPGLFINLIQGSQSKATAYDDRFYAPTLYQNFDSMRDWTTTQRPSYYPPQPTYSTQANNGNLSNSWMPQSLASNTASQFQGDPFAYPNSYVANNQYVNPSAYTHASYTYPQPFSTQQNLQSGYSGLSGTGFQADQAGSSAYSQTQFGNPQYGQNQYGQHQYNQTQYGNPLLTASQPNTWSNYGATLTPSSLGYFGNALASDQWPASQTNGYGSYNSGYPGSTNYLQRSNSGAGQYSALAPRTAQLPLFGNGYNLNSYNTGTVGTPLSAYTYPYQPNGTNQSGWQRYQAPSSPTYR